MCELNFVRNRLWTPMAIRKPNKTVSSTPATKKLRTLVQESSEEETESFVDSEAGTSDDEEQDGDDSSSLEEIADSDEEEYVFAGTEDDFLKQQVEAGLLDEDDLKDGDFDDEAGSVGGFSEEEGDIDDEDMDGELTDGDMDVKKISVNVLDIKVSDKLDVYKTCMDEVSDLDVTSIESRVDGSLMPREKIVIKPAGFSNVSIDVSELEKARLMNVLRTGESDAVLEREGLNSGCHGIDKKILTAWKLRCDKPVLFTPDDDVSLASRAQKLRKAIFEGPIYSGNDEKKGKKDKNNNNKTKLEKNLISKAANDVMEREQAEFADSAARMQTFMHLVNSRFDVSLASSNSAELRCAVSVAALSVSSHLAKVRQEIADNNLGLKKSLEAAREASAAGKGLRDLGMDLTGDDRFRDQGFTRCRVLVLVPFRAQARQFLEELIALHPQGKGVGIQEKKQEKINGRAITVFGRDRFYEEFGEDDDMREKLRNSRRSEDYIEVFGGNCEDNFKLGVSLTSSAVKLYNNFSTADLIIASPLGLRLLIGAPGDSDRNTDLLSSVETVVVIRPDVIEQQNIDHLEVMLESLNIQPSDITECDIRRLRLSAASGHAPYTRQTISISGLRSPAIRSLMNRQRNFRAPAIQLYTASTGEVAADLKASGVRQIFQSFPKSDKENLLKDAMSAFETVFWPSLLCNLGRLIIVVPTYIEYLAFKKMLDNMRVDFLTLHEQSNKQHMSRTRMLFATGRQGEKPILTTERFLFYRRYRIKGADAVCFPLGPPSNPVIYKELLEGCRNRQNACAAVYFNDFHSLALERITGAQTVKKLVCADPYKVFVL